LGIWDFPVSSLFLERYISNLIALGYSSSNKKRNPPLVVLLRIVEDMTALCSRCKAAKAKDQPRTCVQVRSHGGPCAACKKRAAIRHQIKQLEEEIAKLKDEHDALATVVNATHDPFINKLPPEIGSHILRLSLPMLNDGERDQEAEGLPSIWMEWAAPLKLGSVCRQWRQLAWATPDLWTILYIRIKPTMSPSTAKSLPGLLREWLGRSGALPLTIHFFHGGNNLDSDSEDDFSDTDRTNRLIIATGLVIPILNCHSSRWRNLHLKARGDIFEHFASSVEPKQLVTLDLDMVEELPMSAPKFVMESKLNPTRLKLTDFPLTSINICWGNVTHATLCEITIDKGLDFLRRAPSLEYYRVSMYEPQENEDIGLINPILHPRLRSLHLSTDCLQDVLEVINVPSLEEWTQDRFDELHVAAMLSLLERSGCCLKILNLDGHSPPAEDIETLLQAIPSLERIQLSSSWLFGSQAMIDAILTRIFLSVPTISVENPTSESFLPRLRFIECRTDRFASLVSWGCIPELYRHGHRQSLTLKGFAHKSDITDQTALQLLQLTDEGVDLQIADLTMGGNFLENFKNRNRKGQGSL
jgi:hypothetical protein